VTIIILILFSKSKDDVPVIPQSSTQENQEGMYVYVLDTQNLPRLAYIKTIGQTDDGMWLISEGIKAGDKIVTSGFQKITPGKPVKIVQNAIDNSNVKKESFFSKIFHKISRFFTHKR